MYEIWADRLCQAGAGKRGRGLVGSGGRLRGRAVGEGKRVGGATHEAIDRVAGMGRVVGESQEGSQLTDVFHRREGRRRTWSGVQEFDDVPRPGWATVSVDGALDIRDQMTHTPVHARQGKTTGSGLEGIEPASRKGVNFAESPNVSVREPAVADDAIERRHQPAAGGMGATPIHGGRGHGMTGGAAQGIGSKVGPAE